MQTSKQNRSCSDEMLANAEGGVEMRTSAQNRSCRSCRAARSLPRSPAVAPVRPAVTRPRRTVCPP